MVSTTPVWSLAPSAVIAACTRVLCCDTRVPCEVTSSVVSSTAMSEESVC
ncbi:unannotated protein [freshwater metagenome]|uniref:Unannotated protein n=1 Tax=freshwater metagenome TaxID=449393 RepID=A0A6J7HU94_9ZZZZ